MIPKNTLRKIPGLVYFVRLIRRATAIARGHFSPSGMNNKALEIIYRDEPGNNIFVGYYDHSPFKPNDESVILIHSTRHQAWKRPSAQVPVEIQLLNWKSGKVITELGYSFAWNWQQGARALWIDDDTVVFNIYDPKRNNYYARIVSSDGSHREDLPIPVQEVDSLGRIYSLSYKALNQIRPDYGYRNHTQDQRDLDDNSIEQYNPITKYQRQLVHISDLKEEVELRNGTPITSYKFNHLMISPDANNGIFLFRYFSCGRRVTDLYGLDINQARAYLLVENARISHMCWWDSEYILATMQGPCGLGYYWVHLLTRTVKNQWLYEDGHPSRLNDQSILTDTYPDSYGIRHLLVGSTHQKEPRKVASFPEPLLFQGETRCDLHPSLSRSGLWLQIDCAFGHRRGIAIIRAPSH